VVKKNERNFKDSSPNVIVSSFKPSFGKGHVKKLSFSFSENPFSSPNQSNLIFSPYKDDVTATPHEKKCD